MADRIQEVLVSDLLTDYRELIETRNMFFLATADEKGQPIARTRPATFAFPNYDGNGMYLSMGNILKNPRVGLLFIDLEEGSRLRVIGEASIN